jgi:hypothetical protein
MLIQPLGSHGLGSTLYRSACLNHLTARRIRRPVLGVGSAYREMPARPRGATKRSRKDGAPTHRRFGACWIGPLAHG